MYLSFSFVNSLFTVCSQCQHVLRYSSDIPHLNNWPRVFYAEEVNTLSWCYRLKLGLTATVLYNIWSYIQSSQAESASSHTDSESEGWKSHEYSNRSTSTLFQSVASWWGQMSWYIYCSLTKQSGGISLSSEECALLLEMYCKPDSILNLTFVRSRKPWTLCLLYKHIQPTSTTVI